MESKNWPDGSTPSARVAVSWECFINHRSVGIAWLDGMFVPEIGTKIELNGKRYTVSKVNEPELELELK